MQISCLLHSGPHAQLEHGGKLRVLAVARGVVLVCEGGLGEEGGEGVV